MRKKVPVHLHEAFAHGDAADRPTASADIEGQFYFSADTQDFSQVQDGAWVTVAQAPSGSGPGTLHYQHAIVGGESSWAIDLPASGYTHARVVARVAAAPAADYALAVRLNDDAVQAHYEGGDQGSGADVGGVAPSMGSTSPALVFCTIEVPFYRTTPLMGSIHGVGAGSSGSNPIDPIHWIGTDPVTRVTLRSVESADFTTYTARAATGGLIECWLW